MNGPGKASTTVVQLLLRYLEEEGVGHVFGIPGGPLMPLYEALYASGTIRPILAKHELGAAFMADGYARLSGGLGVCCATTGPGATNAITGLACAALDSSPVMLITAQVATWAFGKGASQESSLYGVDVVNIYRNLTKRSAMLVNSDKAGEIVRGLIRVALSGRRGPVHLNIPADLAKRRTDDDFVPSRRYRASAENFDRGAVQEAAKLLLKARRPAILAGHGVSLSGAFPELRRLAERLTIPVATSPKAKGAFPEDHLLSLGVYGFAGSPRAEAYLAGGEVDALLTVGTSLGETTTNAWDTRILPKKALIQIDVDPAEIGKNYPTTLGIVGDAKTVLRELVFQIEREARWLEDPPPPAAAEALIRAFKKKHPRWLRPELLDDERVPLQPPRLMRELQEALPEEAALFVDIGNCVAWAVHYLQITRPRSFFINLGFASMGHSIPAAIGGKLAAPERPVVCLTGDAAFAMSGMEVHTAVEHDAGVVWIVLNNGAHGMVYHGERAQFGGKFVSSKFRAPLDIAGMARALGARAIVVERPGELARALPEALACGRPTVIDARVDLETVPPTALRFETLDRFFAGQHSLTIKPAEAGAAPCPAGPPCRPLSEKALAAGAALKPQPAGS